MKRAVTAKSPCRSNFALIYFVIYKSIVVKIRNLGGKLGFEKIIIKNGMMIMFFIANQMSPYYKSKVFTGILENINANDQLFNLKQSEGKLKIVTRGIDSLTKALQTLNKLQ